MLAGVPRLVDRMSAPNRQGLFRAAQRRVSPTTSELGPRTSEVRNRSPDRDAGLRTPDLGTPGLGTPAPGLRTPARGRRPGENRVRIFFPRTWTAEPHAGLHAPEARSPARGD